MSYPTFETKLAFFYKENDNKVKKYPKDAKSFLTDWMEGRIYRDVKVISDDLQGVHDFVKEAVSTNHPEKLHLLTEDIRRNLLSLDHCGLAPQLLAYLEVNEDIARVETLTETQAAYQTTEGAEVSKDKAIYPPIYSIDATGHFTDTQNTTGDRLLYQALRCGISLIKMENDILLDLLWTSTQTNPQREIVQLDEEGFKQLRDGIWQHGLTCDNILVSLEIASTSPLFADLDFDPLVKLDELAASGVVGRYKDVELRVAGSSHDWVLQPRLHHNPAICGERKHACFALTHPATLGVRIVKAGNTIHGQPLTTTNSGEPCHGWHFYRHLGTVVANFKAVQVGTMEA